ncbi:MAG: cellulase family glycosylhydrolase [Clostridia bacterium]|nr:cellulase family glycosylhydrolase [Clostridia bacterium]
MNRIIRRMLAVCLTPVLLLSCVLLPGSAAAPQTDPKPARAPLTQEDFLHTEGQKLVNEKGEPVVLRGVNLGAWMIWEDWLCPYEEVAEHAEALEVLTERFGEEGAYALFNTYLDNFITDYDLDEIQAMGFNCVRVPFWFRNFYYDDAGRKILDAAGNWDFSRLDWVVDACAQRGLYVILDLHGAVGYQSDAPHSGKGKSCGLYDDTPESERYRELTGELWTAIASRFRDAPAVAMYDLLNEPMCDVDCGELTRRKNNTMIYTRLYEAVRAADPDHIITLECIWTPLALPHAVFKGWKNVVYQVHFYQNSDFIFNLFVWLARLYYADVPMLMGEFYPHKKTTWKNCFSTMEKYGFSWMLWTYKAAGHGMWEGDWCLRGSKDGFERAKLRTDSFEEIARKWGACMRTENGYQDSGHYERDVAAFLR